MITSLSWLKNHLATKANLNQVVERLTEIGLEVENIKSSNGNLDNFIICKIIKSQKHPNADKLKLCEVDIGTGNFGQSCLWCSKCQRWVICCLCVSRSNYSKN